MRSTVSIILIIISAACFGQTEPDTLDCLSSLSGSILFDEQGSISYVCTDTLHRIGDEFDVNYGEFLAEYVYLSFPIPNIPEGYCLDNAQLKFNVSACFGNNIWDTYPLFDYADSTICPALMIDHIDYGGELDQSDVQIAPDQLTVPMFILDSLYTGWVNIDVTDWLRDDQVNSRLHNQYRLRLQGDSDWDSAADFISIFGEIIDGNEPHIVYQVTDSVSVEHDFAPRPNSALTAYPNPFNPSVSIRFSLPQQALVKLSIYNVRGQRVTTLVDEHLAVGDHCAVWDGRDERMNIVAGGVYLLRLQAGERTEVRKVLMVK